MTPLNKIKSIVLEREHECVVTISGIGLISCVTMHSAVIKQWLPQTHADNAGNYPSLKGSGLIQQIAVCY